MNSLTSNKYTVLILLHLLIGAVATVIPFITKIITPTIFILGCYFIIKNSDKNHEALFFSAYVVGIEVFLRMTSGMIFNEYAKYSIMVFCFIGLMYQRVKIEKIYFIIIFVLLIPGIFIGLLEASNDVDLRKAMMFNISGQLCLITASIYTLNNEISYQNLIKIPIIISLPILAILSYIIIKTPDLKEAIISTQSNFATSGGFGPNQVSTILGFGTFCYFAIYITYQKSYIIKLITIILFIVCAYRGLLTMSRGGMICAAIMVVCFMGYLFVYGNVKVKQSITQVLVIGLIGFVILWTYIIFATGGLIQKRYNNQDAKGRQKESVLTGREVLIESEFQMFFDNPIFGIGVGRNKEVREEMIGVDVVSHNEISRLLAEHGIFGGFVLLMQIMLPLLLWYNNKQHILLIPFFIFWALTINHAAMRTAAPAFVYALCLLKVYIPETTNKNENSLSRQSVTT